MPINITEIVSDLAPLYDIYNAVEAAIPSLPAAATRKFADYGPLLASVLPKLLALIDTIEAQAKS
jgi:hypothetical protein